MKRVGVYIFFVILVFISSCSIFPASNPNSPSEILRRNAGRDLEVSVSVFPPPKDITSDTPFELSVSLKNKAKEPISGVIEVEDSVLDLADYGGVIGTQSTGFFLEGVQDGRKPVEERQFIPTLDYIQYKNARDLRNVVFSIVIKTSKNVELTSTPFCVQKYANEIISGCSSRPSVSFLDSSVVKIRDFEFFATKSDNILNKLRFDILLNEDSNCNIIKEIREDLSTPSADENKDQNNIVKATVSLEQLGYTMECQVKGGSAPNQKVIKCGDTGEIVIGQNYYKGEKIRASLSYGCSYLFTTNVDLLKGEET